MCLWKTASVRSYLFFFHRRLFIKYCQIYLKSSLHLSFFLRLSGALLRVRVSMREGLRTNQVLKQLGHFLG